MVRLVDLPPCYCSNRSKAGGVGKSALTGNSCVFVHVLRSWLTSCLTVRFISDVFVETYDPTIEGSESISFSDHDSLQLSEQYSRTITVDGKTDEVR